MPRGNRQPVEHPCAICGRETAGEDHTAINAYGHRFCSFHCIDRWHRSQSREARRRYAERNKHDNL